MGALEEKKSQLGVNKLGFEQQKELFDDFVQVGGKVVELNADPKKKMNHRIEDWIQQKEENQRRQELEEIRAKQEEEAKRRARENAQKRLAANSAPRETPAAPSASQKPQFAIPETRPTPDFLSRLAAKILCILYGIFNFWGNRFSRRFLDQTLLDLQSQLLEARQILASLLHQDKNFSKQLREKLFQSGFPYYYELVYRFDQLYSEDIFIWAQALRNASDPIRKGREVFIPLFKRILLLSRYQPSLRAGLTMTMRIEREVRNLDPAVEQVNMRKLNKLSHFIFDVYYPKLVNLCDFYYKDDLTAGKKIFFKDMLDIQETDVIGYLTRQWQEEEEKEIQRREQEARQKEMDAEKQAREEISAAVNGAPMAEEIALDILELPEPVKNGILLFRQNVNFSDVMHFYRETKDPRMLYPINDYVFLTSSLVEFFDREFTFLFISSSVTLNVVNDRGVRRDAKGNLKDLYFKIDEYVYKRAAEYLKIVTELKKVNASEYMRSREQFAQLNQLGLHRSQISRSLRNQAAKLMEDFSRQFAFVVEDYERDKQVIQNPDELLTFDTRILGKRISHKEKVIDIFRNAYYCSSALKYLLTDGEIGGSGVTLNHPVYLKIDLTEVGTEDNAINPENMSGH